MDPGPGTGSEDVGILADSAHAPCAYWLLGGADPQAFGDAQDFEALARVVRGLPSNHSPQYAPVVEPTLSTGVRALVTAARTWIAGPLTTGCGRGPRPADGPERHSPRQR
ncbi:hypothetical protein ACFYRD_23175 [Streptomyces hirsutus]|uniref:hypothetical protein n=1 Tax=Streptomyces hirsutus TaxID=35620 RepID=UPI0033AB134C